MLSLQDNYRGHLLQSRRAAPAPVATCGRVALPKYETILLRVLLAAEGVFGPFRPQEDVDEKASDPA